MNKPKTIRVMACDIRGATRNPYNCPIACALNRVYPGNEVGVFDQFLVINCIRFQHTDDTREYVNGCNCGPWRAATLTMPDIEVALK